MKDVVVIPTPVPAASLRRYTDARVGIGRAGSSLTTRAHLEFVGDHARARDAVRTAVDFASVAARLESAGFVTTLLHSRASDRTEYLRRPDLGRLLDDASMAQLGRLSEAPPPRVAIVIADGLSAEAIDVNAVPVAVALRALLDTAETGAPVFLVEQGRVAIGDPIGETLGAEIVVVLIGERPGLSAADSLGCYVTWSPKTGTPDARRNCISNIRAGGLSAEDAAQKIAQLVRTMRERRMSGVGLEHAGATGR